MAEESVEGAFTIEELDRPIEGKEDGPISIDMTDEQNSIEEAPAIESQEEKPQEMEQAPEKPRIIKRKQKRRITSYLSKISKQVEKHGNQINKLTMLGSIIAKAEADQIDIKCRTRSVTIPIYKTD